MSAPRPTCEAHGCYVPVLTTYTDGAGRSWDLCEHHGDLLAVGFPTKRRGGAA